MARMLSDPVSLSQVAGLKSPVLPPHVGLLHRDVWLAMRRGWCQRCPACGDGALYGKYLKVEPACSVCGQELHHQRADDAPPYFTMLIVAHVVIGLLLAVERTYQPALWIHALLWGPLTIGLSLWLLPRIKGALIGQQWALRMHGFGSAPDPALPEVWPPVLSRAILGGHALDAKHV